jgi:hypothetical protein
VEALAAPDRGVTLNLRDWIKTLGNLLQYLLSLRLNDILPAMVFAEIIFILLFSLKNGIRFKGGSTFFASAIIFFIGSFLNLLTSFGYFIVPAGSDGSFSVHPVVWIIQCLIFIPAWILLGVGLFMLYRDLVKKKKERPMA